jgi:hypothetical protein
MHPPNCSEMWFFSIFISFAPFFILQAPAIGTDDSVNAPIDYGPFRNPSAAVRPKWRYWIPDASVNLSGTAYDIAQMAQKGSGGFELLGYGIRGIVLQRADMKPKAIISTANCQVTIEHRLLQSTGQSTAGEHLLGVGIMSAAGKGV